MSNSPLISYTKISPNRTVPRNHEIDTITIHCMAGNLSLEQCGNIFADKSKDASSNYGIDSNGKIAIYVEEKDRSWCSSNSANDNRAVTIEVANDGGANTGWHVSDKALASLIKLCADICKRNVIHELKWKGDKALIGDVQSQNMTVHRWFANKSCPGDYLYMKHSYIAEEVNKILNGTTLDYSVVFNANYYANRYADLKNAFGYDREKLLSHFLTNGINEKRQACATFNVGVYKDKNADLQKAFGNNMNEYVKHYILFGQYENRQKV